MNKVKSPMTNDPGYNPRVSRSIHSVFSNSGVLLMPEINHIDANSGDVLLMVGTMKGTFLLSSNADRRDWTVGGPYFPGRTILVK
jgi:hypothetical protein